MDDIPHYHGDEIVEAGPGTGWATICQQSFRFASIVLFIFFGIDCLTITWFSLILPFEIYYWNTWLLCLALVLCGIGSYSFSELWLVADKIKFKRAVKTGTGVLLIDLVMTVIWASLLNSPWLAESAGWYVVVLSWLVGGLSTLTGVYIWRVAAENKTMSRQTWVFLLNVMGLIPFVWMGYAFGSFAIGFVSVLGLLLLFWNGKPNNLNPTIVYDPEDVLTR